VCRQDIFDLNYDYLPRGFQEHLEVLAKNEYAEYIDILASSRLLEGRIRLYRPDQEAPIFIVDEKYDEPDNPVPIMMTAGWVCDSGSGPLDHFELWQEPKEDAIQSEGDDVDDYHFANLAIGLDALGILVHSRQDSSQTFTGSDGRWVAHPDSPDSRSRCRRTDPSRYRIGSSGILCCPDSAALTNYSTKQIIY
jgi:hypothetical protein